MRFFIALFTIICAVSISNSAYAQQEYDSTKVYLVIKNDGTEYTGKIIKKDEREILIETTTVGRIYIPMHEVKAIKELNEENIGREGEFISDDPFATRYFLTTNALPIPKGETYALFNWYGPEVHWGATDRFGIGVMTTWVGIPLVLDAKYTIPLSKDEKVNLSFGTLLGTGSWANIAAAGALPFASVTVGDRTANFSLTGGGLFTTSEAGSIQQPLLSVAGLTRISNKVTFVFDSFIVMPTNDVESTVALVTPGLRFRSSPNRAFQFGFSGVIADGEAVPIPLPNLGWFVKF